MQASFRDGIEGSLPARSVQLMGRVRAVYGPISSWEQTLPVDVPQRGMRLKDAFWLRCDQLTGAEAAPLTGEQHNAFVVRAVGNTVVESDMLDAYAHKLSYDQRKDQLILEADAYTKAKLIRRGEADSDLVAGKITYSATRQQVSIQEFEGGTYADQRR
jgi:hypothetical protein